MGIANIFNKKKPLIGLRWEDKKIVDSEGRDLTDKIKVVGGEEILDTFKSPGEKPLKKYVPKRLKKLKSTNAEYQNVNSYILLKGVVTQIGACVLPTKYMYKFQFSEIQD